MFPFAELENEVNIRVCLQMRLIRCPTQLVIRHRMTRRISTWLRLKSPELVYVSIKGVSNKML